MTVVVNEQNKAYILKQQVAEGYTLDDKTQVVKNGLVYNKADDAPIAANPTDINSWVPVGTDFSGDISDLDGRIDTLETFKTAVDARLSIADDSGLALDSLGGLKVNIAEDTDTFINGIDLDQNGALKVSTYNLRARQTTDAGFAAQYDFIRDGNVLTTINIPKDQFLKSATFHATAEDGVTTEAPYLKFVWDLDINPDLEGIQNVTYVPVKDLVDTYTEGDYITIQDNKVSVLYAKLRDDIAKDFKLADLATNVGTLTTTVGNETSGLVADVAKNTTDISSINSVLTPLSTTVEGHSTTIAQHTNSIQGLAGNVATIMTGALTHVDDTASHGIKLEYSDKELEGDWTANAVKVSVDLEALRADLSVNASAVLTTEDIKDKEENEDARYEKGTSVQSIIANLNTRINEIDADIQGALAGGVTNVGAGNGISVDSSVATKPVVSIKTAANSALKATTDGLDIFWSEL